VYKIIHLAVFVGADLCLRVTEHAGSVPANADCDIDPRRSSDDVFYGFISHEIERNGCYSLPPDCGDFCGDPR
jgi:hypothetical protein